MPYRRRKMRLTYDRPPDSPVTMPGGGDVVVEVKNVVRVVGVLDRGQARALGLGVGAAYACRALVAERVDISAHCERLELGGCLPCRSHPQAVLAGIAPFHSGDIFKARVAVAERRLVIADVGD